MSDGWGARLRSERERLKLTPKQLAARVAANEADIVGYEEEAIKAEPDHLRKMMYLGVDLDYVSLGRRNANRTIPKPDNFNWDLYRVVGVCVEEILQEQGRRLPKMMDHLLIRLFVTTWYERPGDVSKIEIEKAINTYFPPDDFKAGLAKGRSTNGDSTEA